MPTVFKGRFYDFERQRVISRAGQPLETRTGIEIGREISREDAFKRVRAGKDVYTPGKQEAYRLAADVLNGTPLEEIHKPNTPSPTGREDVYFRHFHPGGVHPGEGGPGHVYFGERGEGLQEAK